MKAACWITALAMACGCQAVAHISTIGGLGHHGNSSSGSSSGQSGGRHREFHFYKMVVFQPESDVATVKPMRPSWCASMKNPGWNGEALHQEIGYLKQRWSMARVVKVAKGLCTKPSDPKIQQQTAYVVQSLVNVSGLTPAQAVASISGRVHQAAWQKQRKAICSKLQPSEEASVVAKKLASAKEATFGCYRNGPAWLSQNYTKLGWYLDGHPDHTSEILRSHYVLACLDGHDGKFDTYARLAYAACGMDARALSERALEAELAKKGYKGYAAILAREQEARARLLASRIGKRAHALAAKEKAWQKILFDAPKAGWQSWYEQYRANQKPLEDSLAFEADFFNPSRSAVKGCGNKLRGDFFQYLRSKAPKTSHQAKEIATGPVGSQIVLHLTMCEAAQGHLFDAKVLGLLADAGSRVRGPRAAAYYAIANAIGAADKDRPRFPVHPKDAYDGSNGSISLYSKAANLWINKVDTDRGTKTGVVKAVKHQGDSVVVSFRTVSWREPRYSCHSTGRIKRIDSNGDIIYWEHCHKAGYRHMKATPQTIQVSKAYAAGIRRGALVKFKKSFTRGVARGMPVAVWRSKAHRHLAAYFGAPL